MLPQSHLETWTIQFAIHALRSILSLCLRSSGSNMKKGAERELNNTHETPFFCRVPGCTIEMSSIDFQFQNGLCTSHQNSTRRKHATKFSR